jgi:hypothetical protein
LKNDIKLEENDGTNILNKYPMSESFKKIIPKYKKKFLASYSRVGRFSIKFLESIIIIVIFSIIDSMSKMKEDLFKETNNLENILDEFRNVFKPRDIGSFLLDVEQVGFF